MDRFEAMRTFVAAVDGGSLSAASRALNMPLPTVSRRVSDLEAQLGTQLVVRTSRKLILTEAGTAYLAAVRRVLDGLAEAERAASGEYRAPRGELLIAAPMMFGKLHVAPIVHEFLGAYPDVTVRLVLSDSVIDLVEERFDLAVRIGRLPDSTLLARRVGTVRWMIAASPGYLARRGAPERPEAISAHDCIAFEGVLRYREWPLIVDGAERRLPIRPRFSVNTADAVIAGAVAGLGLARVMSYQAVEAVRAGTIVPVLSDYWPDAHPVQLVHAPHAHQPLKLRAFLDFVTPRLNQRLSGIARDIDAVLRGEFA